MRKSNYDKLPAIKIEGEIISGWDTILSAINAKNATTIAIETYQGVIYEELKEKFSSLTGYSLIDTASLMFSEQHILDMTEKDVTDDAIFGFITRLRVVDFLNPELCKKVDSLKKKIIFGYGASIVAKNADLLIYADMPRWELQMRQRRSEVSSIGVKNSHLPASLQYKRGFFVDWRACDALKKELLTKADFWLDTTDRVAPKMISGATHLKGLELASKQPFRVVPFFDPAPWGGQWMKEVCDLDRTKSNFGWCFDCVPEENSLLFNIKNTIFEIPSINLVFYKTEELLGRSVQSRFGAEFPIRFDFLDTIKGGNLSLQVHPTKQFIKDSFGMDYTQDESYYMLDTEDGATVYLGVKDSSQADEIIENLKAAQEGKAPFDADKYINVFPAKKHDHFLIPNGTIHCSGTGAMVLEISATPYIFTFKLWDWGRLGLDGKPRPINIERGKEVIDFRRNTEFCKKELVNNIQLIAEGDGWKEERTGLHEMEFIETRRHWFTKPVLHNTGGSVNVINLVEGDAAIISSPINAFAPYEVHYTETFIVPASVNEYIITPCGNYECATLKAYVRFKD